MAAGEGVAFAPQWGKGEVDAFHLAAALAGGSRGAKYRDGSRESPLPRQILPPVALNRGRRDRPTLFSATGVSCVVWFDDDDDDDWLRKANPHACLGTAPLKMPPPWLSRLRGSLAASRLAP